MIAPKLPPPEPAPKPGGSEPGGCRRGPAGVPAARMQAYQRFVGLDVHKKMVVACVLDAAGQKLHTQEFACTAKDLEAFGQRWLGPAAAAVLEATSNTWAVVNVLGPHCGQIAVSNPLKTKAIAQATVKTDKVDAQVLAHLLRCDYLPKVWVADPATRNLRQLTARRTALVQDRTSVRNRIHSTLAGELVVVPFDKLFEKLDWLKSAPLTLQARAFVDSDLRLLESLDGEIAILDKELARQAWQDEQVKLLLTLPGVDYHVAMTLLAALGDISRFQDGDHAASYLGLAPSTYQSAEHCYHGPITKQGNSHARWMLIEAAQHLDKHPGPLGVFFRRIANKKNRNVAVVATARKLVVIALLMLRENQPYRYAQPATVKAKLARLRLAGGGARRAGGNPKGIGRHPNYGTGQGQRRIPSLQQLCQSEGLPVPTPLEDLPPGEREMLERTGTLAAVRSMRQASCRPKTKGR
jgi:transposase